MVTNTLIFHTTPAAQAVVEAAGLGTVLTDEAFLTETRPLEAMAIAAAVQQAEFNAAVIPIKTLKTFTSAINAATLVLAVVGTLRFCAVGALPSWFT